MQELEWVLSDKGWMPAHSMISSMHMLFEKDLA